MKLMKVISVVLHPLMMTTYLMAIFYFFIPEIFSPIGNELIPRFLLTVLITTAVLPMLFVSMMKMAALIPSLEMTRRQDRIIPFISILIFYSGACYIFISKLAIAPPLSAMMIGTTLLIFSLLIVTLKFKISIHASAIWACSGMMAALSIKYTGMVLLVPLSTMLVLGGIVSASRLSLQVHSGSEIWSGIITGFVFGFATVFWFT